jgi:Ca2+-transporting ATPase
MDKGVVYYRISEEQVLKELESSANGLTQEEAARRLTTNGPNRLLAINKESSLHKYFRQFKDLMILLLLASGALSLYLGDKQTAIVLVALVIFNTVIGFAQEFKAERIMESLEKLVVPSAKVLRGGTVDEVSATELVIGDVVYIEEGDSVPADLRLVDEFELSTNDFALTGESNPSRKFLHVIESEVPIGSRGNQVFMGTTVATGHAYGVVIATGMQTELGRIANLSQSAPTQLSPLQKELNHIASRVTIGTVVLCTILLPIAIAADLGLKQAFLFAIGFASSIIPQGLPAEINTALAQAANKLVRARALVKKLSAVETLGATSIICTDKTGTLTKNEMTVEQLMIGHTVYRVSGTGYEPNGHIINGKQALAGKDLKELVIFFATGALASNAHVHPPDKEHQTWYTVGDPTEGALITLAEKAGIDIAKLEKDHPEIKEFTFDSGRKRMSSIRTYGDSKQIYVFVKGAPESVLERCDDLWDHGHSRTLTKKDRSFISDYNIAQAEEAMRNLGYGFKVLPKGTNVEKLTMEQAETGLTWLGMVNMIDPLREEVPAAFQEAHDAHIKVSIITGDFALTARAIATKAGLTPDPKDIVVVEGDKLKKLPDHKVLQLVEQGGVIFSRVSPEDKLRIVELVKKGGHIVAVTGDGINDAPALKRANIGVAMGRTGTDVAKQSAEIVLLDDSFHTLIGAVKEGRVIYQNIQKGSLSCFTSNGAELVVNIVSLAITSLLGIPLAISIMQILAIDMIAELFPIAALGWDKGAGSLMNESPRNIKHHILNKKNIIDLLWCGLLIGGMAYINYLLFFARAHVDPTTVDSGSHIHMQATALTYLTIVLCQLGNILQRRTPDGIFSRYQFHNRYLWGSMLFSMVCVLAIIYSPINSYFGSAPLHAIDWLYALMAAAIFLGVREFQRGTQHHTREAVLALHREKGVSL